MTKNKVSKNKVEKEIVNKVMSKYIAGEAVHIPESRLFSQERWCYIEKAIKEAILLAKSSSQKEIDELKEEVHKYEELSFDRGTQLNKLRNELGNLAKQLSSKDEKIKELDTQYLKTLQDWQIQERKRINEATQTERERILKIIDEELNFHIECDCMMKNICLKNHDGAHDLDLLNKRLKSQIKQEERNVKE